MIKKPQLFWLCWMLLTQRPFAAPLRPGYRPDPVPAGFATRCRKLIEQGLAAPAMPGRSGVDTLFDRFQAWEMAIGLLLSDLGLPQGHIAFCLNHMRTALRTAYDRICANLPTPRERVLASDRPHAPRQPDDPNYADTDCFLLLRPVELRDALPKRSAGRKKPADEPQRQPFILFDSEQDIVFGAADLARRLALRQSTSSLGRGYGERGWIVLEISELVVEIDRHWDRVPQIRRGRPA